MEDSYVLNTRARRSSILANQARAHTKLQRRIEQRKCITTACTDAAGGEERTAPHSPSGPQPSPGRRIIDGMSSFEIFNEKKGMVKNYTAHQSLREHSLEIQRQEAKASLKLRVSEKKKVKADA